MFVFVFNFQKEPTVPLGTFLCFSRWLYTSSSKGTYGKRRRNIRPKGEYTWSTSGALRDARPNGASQPSSTSLLY